MFGLGLPEIIIIAVVILLFFGKDRLPELARSIGQFGRELKGSLDTEGDKNTAPPDTAAQEKRAPAPGTIDSSSEGASAQVPEPSETEKQS
ncbi:twin-arginine translocase TatA/TatE family subunit [Patescibacteria group bacterium]|nr:twin-arginine translocase TatA/TatE family subunit [Patescibacteria group bacterium]